MDYVKDRDASVRNKVWLLLAASFRRMLVDDRKQLRTSQVLV